jgi:predicted amidohydrolase YtcJ
VVEARKLFNTDKLRLIGLKAIADSVWADRSAAVLREYKGDPGNFGQLYLDPKVWGDKIAEGNKHGLSTHLHCSGNRAVRASLDVYEESIRRNGSGDYRNTIEHCDTIHPDDIPRFAKLGVLANVAPDFMYKTNRWKDSPCHTVYDDETRSWCWPFHSLIETGAVVTYGCDSPASTLDPLVQIFRAANRVMEDGEPKGGFIPSEKVSARDALKCYTYNSAYEARMEDKLGTLEEGKYADIIVLDRDIVEIDPLEIRNASVVMTIADGQLVYQK